MENSRDAKLWVFVIAGITTAAAALFFFGWRANEMLGADTAVFDTVVSDAIHRLASPAMTGAMLFFSFLGSAAFLVGLTLVTIRMLLLLHGSRAASLLAITMAGAVVLDLMLKYALPRPRPAAFLGTSPTSYSFPRGHALGSPCFYGALAVILSTSTRPRRERVVIWSLAGLLIVMIGLSSIYLRVHYPSDVLAGYSAGVVWVAVVGCSDKLLRSWARE